MKKTRKEKILVLELGLKGWEGLCLGKIVEEQMEMLEQRLNTYPSENCGQQWKFGLAWAKSMWSIPKEKRWEFGSYGRSGMLLFKWNHTVVLVGAVLYYHREILVCARGWLMKEFWGTYVSYFPHLWHCFKWHHYIKFCVNKKSSFCRKWLL